MINSGIPPLVAPGWTGTPGAQGAGRPADSPEKARDAAKQFEALLIGQILRSARESGSGWLGSGGDSASDCATDLAEQQLARLLAERGGLGLASLIAAGLEKKSE